MSTDIRSEAPASKVSEGAEDIAHQAVNAARETASRAAAIAGEIVDVVKGADGIVADAAKDAAKGLTDAAKDIHRSAVLTVGDTLQAARDSVRRNPWPVVMANVALGALIGYLLTTARRKPTFAERYADEPAAAVREAILGAFAPVAQRAHAGYDWARESAGKAMDRAHGLGSGRNGDSLSHRIVRIGNHLKFW